MALINHSTRLPARCLALLGVTTFTMIGLAGTRHTIAHWNQEKDGELAFSQSVEEKKRTSIAAIEAKEQELAGQARLAEAASELGARQPNCTGDTLSQFYFQSGVDVVQQLSAWGTGFDWGAPRYNSDQWFPLFDSSGVLFAAIRGGREFGKPEIVSKDQQPLDHASICNLNQLSKEN